MEVPLAAQYTSCASLKSHFSWGVRSGTSWEFAGKPSKHLQMNGRLEILHPASNCRFILVHRLEIQCIYSLNQKLYQCFQESFCQVFQFCKTQEKRNTDTHFQCPSPCKRPTCCFQKSCKLSMLLACRWSFFSHKFHSFGSNFELHQESHRPFFRSTAESKSPPTLKDKVTCTNKQVEV